MKKKQIKEVMLNQQEDGSYKIESELPFLPMPLVEQLLNEALKHKGPSDKELIEKTAQIIEVLKIQRMKIRILWVVIIALVIALFIALPH